VRPVFNKAIGDTVTESAYCGFGHHAISVLHNEASRTMFASRGMRQ